MVRTNGFLIRYLPQHCSLVQDILAQIPEILPGFQVKLKNWPPPPTNGQPTMAGSSSQQLHLGTQSSLATSMAPIPDRMAYITKEQSSTPKAAGNPNSICDPTVFSLQDKIAQLFWLRYTEKARSSYTVTRHYNPNSTCPILLSSGKS